MKVLGAVKLAEDEEGNLHALGMLPENDDTENEKEAALVILGIGWFMEHHYETVIQAGLKVLDDDEEEDEGGGLQDDPEPEPRVQV